MKKTSSSRWIAAALLAAGGLCFAILGEPRRSPPAKPSSDPVAQPSRSKPAPAPRPNAAKSAARDDRGAKPARAEPKGEVVLRAAWGAEPGMLGHKLPVEGAPEGPMSFAPMSDGRVAVLDQVNARIQVMKDGEAPRVIALPSDTYQDIAVDPRGAMVVLDRLATGTIAFVDPSGRVDHSIPIAGAGVSETAAVTGVFAREDGVWLEVEHQSLVRVADAKGDPDPERPAVPGRFTLGGASTLRVAISGPTTAVLTRESLAAAAPPIETTLSFAMSILGIHALEADGQERAYVVVNQIRESDEAPFDVLDEKETVVIVDASGRETGRIEIAPPPATSEEQFRPIRVDAQGNVYELRCGKDNATIERFAR